MENETKNGAGEKAGQVEIIREYMRGLQKKSVESRKKNDPNSYKKMARKRWEDKEDLEIKVE